MGDGLKRAFAAAARTRRPRQPRNSPWGVVALWKCVGAHDRCNECGGECPYCEPVYLHDLAAEARRKRTGATL